jgi:tRNA pseudouridine65 synthase
MDHPEEFSHSDSEPIGLLETDDFIDEKLSKPLQILYQDEHYVAVFKPAGLVVHRSKMTRPDEPVLLQTLRDQLDRFVYPVHRLDRPTAGLILFGLTGQDAAKMVDLFTTRQVSKYYQALVRGFTPETGIVDKPLREKFGEELDPGSTENHPTQEATTEYEVLERYQIPWPMSGFQASRFSLLELKPWTGRWHQIRRHLNHIAHPVIGDHRHGDHRYNQLAYAKTGVYRMLLTAMRLDFRHPYTGELHTIMASRGSEFDRFIEVLNPYKMPREMFGPRIGN